MLNQKKFIPIFLVFFIVCFSPEITWATPGIGQQNMINTDPLHIVDNNSSLNGINQEQKINNITTNNTYSKLIKNIYNKDYLFAGVIIVSNIYGRLTNMDNAFAHNTLMIKSLFTNNLVNAVSKGHNTTTIITTTNVGPNEQQVDIEFKKIQSLQYNSKTMNCVDKSNLFARYLYENGARQIGMVVIEHNSGKYSHEFVEWDGHYYDACDTGTSYTEPKAVYLKKLSQIGFSGLTITSPYNP